MNYDKALLILADNEEFVIRTPNDKNSFTGVPIEIRRRYLFLMRKYHPDRHQGDSKANEYEEKSKIINRAYLFLKLYFKNGGEYREWTKVGEGKADRESKTNQQSQINTEYIHSFILHFCYHNADELTDSEFELYYYIKKTIDSIDFNQYNDLFSENMNKCLRNVLYNCVCEIIKKYLGIDISYENECIVIHKNVETLTIKLDNISSLPNLIIQLRSVKIFDFKLKLVAEMGKYFEKWSACYYSDSINESDINYEDAIDLETLDRDIKALIRIFSISCREYESEKKVRDDAKNTELKILSKILEYIKKYCDKRSGTSFTIKKEGVFVNNVPIKIDTSLANIHRQCNAALAGKRIIIISEEEKDEIYFRMYNYIESWKKYCEIPSSSEISSTSYIYILINDAAVKINLIIANFMSEIEKIASHQEVDEKALEYLKNIFEIILKFIKEYCLYRTQNYPNSDNIWYVPNLENFIKGTNIRVGMNQITISDLLSRQWSIKTIYSFCENSINDALKLLESNPSFNFSNSGRI